VYPGGIQAMLRSPKMINEMRKRARRVKSRAIRISPVRKTDLHRLPAPGHYKRSWHYRTGVRNGRAWARVYNTAHYAAYLEFGTRYMKAQRVLSRATNAIRR